MPPYSRLPQVGQRVALVVLWTIVLVVGVGLAMMIAVPAVGGMVDATTRATIEKILAFAAAVAMALGGLWGIAGGHKALKHAVGLLVREDRAHDETTQPESPQFMELPK